MTERPERIAVVGGCGHVGLPLALTFAAKGCDVTIIDTDAARVEQVSRGEVGYLEEGAEPLLRAHLGKNLCATTDRSRCRESDIIVCVVGTPIDRHLHPRLEGLFEAVDELTPFMRAGQLFVLRSTVFPGATLLLASWLEERAPGIDVAYCPERVAQGFAVREIQSLPQIVSGTSQRAVDRARALFSIVAPVVLELEPTEAELSKLFCNSWRYISFAVANQFYALCAAHGIDYYRILDAIKTDYPRAAGLAGAGFAAGPCLFKDTMQLAAFYVNEFSLGQSAMHINEGMPRVLMDQLRRLGLRDKTVGLLGMAFKGDSDDIRDSLAFRMRRLLSLESKGVLCSDEFIRDPEWFVPLERVLEEADVLVISAPHSRYRDLRPTQPTLDPWNLLGHGGLLG